MEKGLNNLRVIMVRGRYVGSGRAISPFTRPHNPQHSMFITEMVQRHISSDSGYIALVVEEREPSRPPCTLVIGLDRLRNSREGRKQWHLFVS